MQTQAFAKQQASSVRRTHINQRRSVSDLVKLRTEITETLSEQTLSSKKSSVKRKHHIEKKSSEPTLIKSENLPETNVIPYYSDLFFEEKNEPSASTVSPFGK